MRYLNFHHQSRLRRNQRGDTIVEVLIAAAIVSLVLAAAYALTNRNLLGIQATQEQSYAQKLVQQQVEFLRVATTKPTGGCFNSSGSIVSGDACKITNGGATYVLKITESGGVYTIAATWDAVGGGTANVTVYYKVSS